ncbi:hypothetical protein N7499_011692 [Penicillium canescens]|nr:hypothetical protein N7499_011692 [Penicillium canescens]
MRIDSVSKTKGQAIPDTGKVHIAYTCGDSTRRSHLQSNQDEIGNSIFHPSGQLISDFESGSESLSNTKTILETSSPSSKPRSSLPSLPADHLLHLIQWNVFRGLCDNKHILGRTVIAILPDSNQAKDFEDVFAEYSLVLPKAEETVNLPPSLQLTEPQMNIVHSTWIHTLPFSQNARESDALGVLFRSFGACQRSHWQHTRSASSLSEHWLQPSLNNSSVGDDYDDEVTASRSGLILWGDPMIEESWEVTPGFLRKWAWTVEGCDELIYSTNQWRRIRGEVTVQLLASD